MLVSLLELERLKVELQSRDEEEREEAVDKENRPEEEQRKLTVVEELKEELQQFHKRRKVERRQRDEEEAHQSRAFEAVQKEIERQEAKSDARPRGGRRVRLPELDVCVSPLTSNAANRRRSPKTTGRKRKSCEVEVGVCCSSTPEGAGRGHSLLRS